MTAEWRRWPPHRTEGNPLYYEDAADELADALLPVVERLCRDSAAAALEEAAAACAVATWPYPIVGAEHPTVGGWLRARAAALRDPQP